MKTDSVFSVEQAEDSTGFLLWQVTSLWQRHLNVLLKSYNLTHAQFVVLTSSYWLQLKFPPLTQVQIATHAKIDVMLTSNILRTLEKKQLVTRSYSKTDTRAKEIIVTEKGIALLYITVKEVEAFDKKFFIPIGNNLPAFNKELQSLITGN